MRLSSTLNQRLTTLPMGKQETDTIKRINNDFDAQTIALDKLEQKKLLNATQKPKRKADNDLITTEAIP